MMTAQAWRLRMKDMQILFSTWYDGKVKTAGTAVEASAEVWYRRDEMNLIEILGRELSVGLSVRLSI
ncbi:Hypothetical predicted protein [Olea europaea subsp. europaea]|uniref:Uncharacterized protein n=1 Tax=Olea europaea subsp. europaea TaxID=158383 RepID=A0A8S0RHR1_OLEEU|nr:Hypothetical predicted protein [Olea europaea subsp. europaea]